MRRLSFIAGCLTLSLLYREFMILYVLVSGVVVYADIKKEPVTAKELIALLISVAGVFGACYFLYQKF